jgi:hypothetical protein
MKIIYFSIVMVYENLKDLKLEVSPHDMTLTM